MMVVEMEVWAKVYAVDVEWTDDLFEETPEWLVEKSFIEEFVTPIHYRLKEVQLMYYTLVLILHSF